MRYSSDSTNDEFETEWNRFGAFLKQNGGLESSLRESYGEFNEDEFRTRETESMTSIMKNVRQYLAEKEDAN
jgi:hypothetical protein